MRIYNTGYWILVKIQNLLIGCKNEKNVLYEAAIPRNREKKFEK